MQEGDITKYAPPEVGGSQKGMNEASFQSPACTVIKGECPDGKAECQVCHSSSDRLPHVLPSN